MSLSSIVSMVELVLVVGIIEQMKFMVIAILQQELKRFKSLRLD